MEGVPWVFVNLCDSQLCLELIEGQPGILDLLNEECKVGEDCCDHPDPPTAPSDLFGFQMPQGSDGSWVQKLYQTHLSSSRSPSFHCLPLCWKGRECCGWGGRGRVSIQWSPARRSWRHLLHAPRVGGGSCWAETPYLRVKLWKLCSGSPQQPRSRARGVVWPPLLTPARTFPKCLDCVQAELCTKLVWEAAG